jgi:hypothetical protein
VSIKLPRKISLTKLHRRIFQQKPNPLNIIHQRHSIKIQTQSATTTKAGFSAPNLPVRLNRKAFSGFRKFLSLFVAMCFGETMC